jgi:hypothetical protein
MMRTKFVTKGSRRTRFPSKPRRTKFSKQSRRTKFPEPKLIEINRLRPGERFLMPLSKIKGKVIFSNKCRTRVLTSPTKRKRKDDIEIMETLYIDISTKTMVIKES